MVSTKVTHLTFDFFGTLVGYTPGHFKNVNTYTKSHNYLLANGLNIDYDAYIKKYSDAFDTLLAQSTITKKEFHMRDVTHLFFSRHLGLVSQNIADTFTELYISEWNSGIILYPEMKSFLQKLKKKYSLSIISNTHYPSLIHRSLKKMEVSDYFDLVITSVEYGLPKPESQIFHETLRQLSVQYAHTVHIGDSYTDDYQGAISAGIRCILLDPYHKWDKKVDQRVNSIFDIEKLL